MGAIPGSVDTAQQPPMTVPLRHFVVGLGFLIWGAVLGIGLAFEAVPGFGRLAHVHLLLAGWICITIMGAMTQFVPVWSGTTIHSRRLANVQLALVVVGLVGFVVAFLSSQTALLAVFGAVMLAGVWTFVYNIGRTLGTVESLDVTERHFAYALGFFLLLTLFGWFLALDFEHSALAAIGIQYEGLVGAHATLAVFGAVLTTVYGALYQLATMFTQTELHGIDHRLQSIEEAGHPAGVFVLAAGRLVGSDPIATIGGLLIVIGAFAVSVILARKLFEMQVERTPMHTRYLVVAVALPLWGVVSTPAWITAPTARAHLLGASGGLYLLLFGVLGFVVLGTLYHIIPFIVWVHRYSDKLGFEDVPMIDDLYDDRLAAIDGSLVFAGTALIVGTEFLLSSALLAAIGGFLVTLGILVFTSNMLLVLHRHGMTPLDRILLGSLSPRGLVTSSEEVPAGD